MKCVLLFFFTLSFLSLLTSANIKASKYVKLTSESRSDSNVQPRCNQTDIYIY